MESVAEILEKLSFAVIMFYMSVMPKMFKRFDAAHFLIN